jgi:hypothetical protein
MQNFSCSAHHKSQRAAVFVEIAVSLLVIFTLIVGTIAFGLQFREQSRLIDIARTSARIGATVAPVTGQDGYNVVSCDVVRAIASDGLRIGGFNPDDFSIAVTSQNMNADQSFSCSSARVPAVKITISRINRPILLGWIGSIIVDNDVQTEFTIDADAPLSQDC